MANFDFQQIIDNLSYGQEEFPSNPVFQLDASSDILLNTNDEDETNIIKYININEEFNKNQSLFASFVTSLSMTDREFLEAAAVFRNISRAPFSFLYNILTGKSSFIKEVKEVQFNNSFFNVISFNSVRSIKVLEQGLGKGLLWSKVQFFVNSPDGLSIKLEGFCLTSKIKQITISNKKSISSEYGLLVKVQGSNPNLFLNNIVYKPVYSPELIDNILYNKEICSYTILTEVELEDFNGVSEQQVKTLFSEAYSRAIKKVLKYTNKKTDKNFEEEFYCFGKIQNYYIGTRIGEKPTIFVTIPWRNIEAVAEVDNTLLESARVFLRSGEVINNIRKSIEETTIFDINTATPSILSVLPPSENSNLKYDYAKIISDKVSSSGATKEYVSPSEIQNIQGRIVLLPFDGIEELQNYILTASDYLREYNEKLVQELEDNEDSESKIRLSLYSESFDLFSSRLKQLLIDNADVLNNTNSLSILNLQLIFDGPKLIDIYLIDDTNDEPLKLNGSTDLASSEPCNDQTFCFFLTNINSINSINTEEKTITDFLSEYVYPSELSRIRYSQNSFNEFKQKELDCLKDYETAAKERLKANSNEFINNIISEETIKNLETSFSKKEWENVFEELKRITNENIDAAIDLRTINWDLIIEELTKCITSVELRDIVIIFLDIIKKWQVNKIPLACQLPPAPIPRFPVIRLPKAPNLPSIVTAYYTNFAVTIVNSRNDLIQTVIRGLIDLASLCRLNIDPSEVGKTKPEDLLRDFSESSLGLESQQEADEVKLVMASTAETLTKNEFITLLVGTASKNTLKLAKTQINKLESNKEIVVLPSKLGDYFEIINETKKTSLSDIKVKDFFMKFMQFIKTEEISNLNEQQLSSNIELLCLTDTTITDNITKALKNKGLSEEQINKELEKREEQIKNIVNSFANSLSALDKGIASGPEIVCKVLEDGTKVQGLNDSLGVPDAFSISKKNTLNSLYSGFDDSYNSDFKSWLNNLTKKEISTSGDARQSQSTAQNIFLGDFNVSWAQNHNLSDDLRLLQSIVCPPLIYGSDKSDDNLAKYFTKSSRASVIVNSFFRKNGDTITSIDTNTDFSSIKQAVGIDFSRDGGRDLTTDDKKVLQDANSIYTKKLSFSKENISLPLTGDGFDFNLLLERTGELSRYNDLLVEKNLYLRYKNSKIFELKKDENQKNAISAIFSTDLNPILTKNDKKCNKLDKRLINTSEIINKVINTNNNCSQPRISFDGKKLEDTPVDTNNKNATLDLFLRLYSIDFNLKLSPLYYFVPLAINDTFLFICYELFKKDITMMFGNTFTESIVKMLQESNLDKNDFVAFKNKFASELKSVNKKMSEMFKDAGLSSSESDKVYDKNLTSYLDFLYETLVLNNQIIANDVFINNNFCLLKRVDGQEKTIELRFFTNNVYTPTGISNSILIYNAKITSTYNFRQDQNLKNAFYTFFTVFYNVDELLASFLGVTLASLTSINKVNNSFTSSKQQLKNVFDIIAAASDYTKTFQDNGFTALMSKLKVLIDIPDFFVTSLAETTDPNVALASPISKAYEIGAIFAELAGVKLPLKKLPLILTSPAIALSGIPPLTPQGYISIALSAKDLAIDTGESVTNEDKEKC